MGGWDPSPRSKQRNNFQRQQATRRSSSATDMSFMARTGRSGQLSPLLLKDMKSRIVRRGSHSVSTSAGSAGSIALSSAGSAGSSGSAGSAGFSLGWKGKTPSSIGRLRGSLVTASMPDMLKAPVKLTPLRKHPASAGRRTLAGWEGFALDGSRSVYEETHWAASTLSSLDAPPGFSSAGTSDKKSPDFLIKDPAPVQEETQEVTLGPEESPEAVEEELPIDSSGIIDGGPTKDEAFARLLSGSDGFPETELRRMFTVYNRFKPVDNTDINKDILPDILKHLNYTIPPKSRKVQSLAKGVSQLPTMDFQDFEHFTMKFAALEKEELRAAFNAFDKEQNEKVQCSAVAAILMKLGLVVQKPTVQEILESQSLAENGFMTFNDFLRFMASYKATQGFTPTQLAKLKKVFAGLAVGVDGGTALKASRVMLVDGLLQAFGEHVHPNLEILLEHTFWHSTKSTPIFFHEFVCWGRRVQELEVSNFQSCFVEADDDEDGLISLDELIEAMQKMGFTLFSQAIDEFLAEVDCHREMEFDFSNFFNFLKAVQKRDGFTVEELGNLSGAYKKYDYDGSGGIDNFELLDLMRYLGFHTHLKDVHRYMKEVDFNGNGIMDVGEFLRLMRLHREEELVKLSEVFNTWGSGVLHITDFDWACKQAGMKGGEDHIQMVMDECGNPETFDFEGFVKAVDALRRLIIQTKRQRAGFSDKEYALIRHLFKKHNKERDGKLDKGDLILLLVDAGVHMRTLDERKRVFEMCNDARESALEAGIAPDDAGRPSSPRMKFWPVVHLLRALLKIDEHGTLHREENAMMETGFEPSEVSEFRDIFLECCRWSAYGDGIIESPQENARAESKRQSQTSRATMKRGSMVADPSMAANAVRRATTYSALPSKKEIQQAHVDANVTLKDLLSDDINLQKASSHGIQVILSRQLGLKFKKEEKRALELQVQKMLSTEENPTPEEDSLDFADFLRLMRWILNTNFARMNDVASTVVEAEKESQKEVDAGKMKNAALATMAGVRLNKAHQRRSV